MTKGKAEYERVIILHRVKKTEQFPKELVPISVRTEDETLSKFIEDFIQKRFEYSTVKVRKDETPQQHFDRQEELRKSAVEARTALLDYCNETIANDKPQWQIIAEQHGWGPLQQKLF